MKIPQLIAICGYKRSGKDTLAAHISNAYGHKHVKIADKLKQIVQILFGFSSDQVETDFKEVVDPKWGISPRQAMQYIGTEVFQYQMQHLIPDIKRNFWIKSCLQDIQALPPGTPVVISDLRFLHEHEHLKALGVYVIRVERPHSNGVCHDQHASEQEFLGIQPDLVVHNTSTPDDMYSQLTAALKQSGQSN